MEAKDGKAYVNSKLLGTEKEIIKVDKGVEGRIR